MKKFLVWLFCLILLTQPVFAQSEKLIILNTNTGQNTDADTGQNAGAGEQNSSDTTENTDNVNTQQTGNVDISAPSALLMEASTGQVIYEKDADSKRPPASVTKVMTLLLIFDALQEGKIHLEDEVTTSEYAASMGGSQVFLEEGETQDVETMIKCIVIASGNDASVAMAEHIGGSEQEFVRQMNERAAGLGMENTHFVDCCGFDRIHRSLHNCSGHCHYEPGADHQISEDPGILLYMDGKYYSCDQTRLQRVLLNEH